MLKKNLLTILFWFIICEQKTIAQTPQAIIKHFISDKKIDFTVLIPLIIKDNYKGLKFEVLFSVHQKIAEIKRISGFNIYTLGLGSCFMNDSLNFSFENGKILHLVSVNPKLCKEYISGWFYLSEEEIKILLSSPITLISFTNNESCETISQIISSPEDQAYFLTIKYLYANKQIVQ